MGAWRYEIYLLMLKERGCLVLRCTTPVYPHLMHISFAGRPRYIDLVFVVDTSSGINWPTMRDFSKDFLKNFDISPAGTHIGYVVYGNGAALRFGFPIDPAPSYPYNRDLVRKQIDGIQPLGGNRKDLFMGLQTAQMAFVPANGGRPGARKV